MHNKRNLTLKLKTGDIVEGLLSIYNIIFDLMQRKSLNRSDNY